MGGYRIAPGISFCDAGGRHIFLDLDADRYFCLGDAAERSFARMIAGTPLDAADHHRLGALARRGLLLPAKTDTTLPPTRIAPIRRAIAEPPARAGNLAVARAAAALLRARLELRRRPLRRLIMAVRRAKRGCAPPDGDGERRLAAIGGAFRRAAVLTGALDECLAVSLAIMRRSAAHGIAAELVLGVKLRPFQAHAWVQVGDLLVSDERDAVAPFTPILVV
ncbi:lasso peptide biosynthesis B2 protein [Sphingomonas cannabina]|uniref:lasso peptide biosynthesis B2 protein n=1 Tax=Sphingomonas cannabina TaxID=2899123 RepID=UPI001F4722A3|nr:lasso peptide biosynthesis B2 protein [Sphingomonas cannabina]UIJ44794.1 lasso peptide biosynthesis B2 protein [Sphingomonas cannabina]